MIESHSKCIKVSDTNICPFCYSSKIVKNGHTKTKKQQYFCKSCDKRFLNFYTYNAYKACTNTLIITFTKEGMGVRSIARVLKISSTTLLRRYLQIAKNIKPPTIVFNQEYEVDEMLFHNIRNESRFIKIQTCIEVKRHELNSQESVKSPMKPNKKQINAVSEERYFSFKETKSKAHPELASDVLIKLTFSFKELQEEPLSIKYSESLLNWRETYLKKQMLI